MGLLEEIDDANHKLDEVLRLLKAIYNQPKDKIQDPSDLKRNYNITAKTLKSWTDKGLPYYKISPKKIFFYESQVQAWIARHLNK